MQGAACNVISPVKYVLCFYISTLLLLLVVVVVGMIQMQLLFAFCTGLS